MASKNSNKIPQKRQKIDTSEDENATGKSRKALLSQIRNDKWRDQPKNRQALAEKERERRKRMNELIGILQTTITKLTSKAYSTFKSLIFFCRV